LANSITVEGFEQLEHRLANMAKVGEAGLMREIGEAFVVAAQANAPVDQSREAKHPGNLRESIHILYAAPRAVGVGAGGPEAPYAAAIEFGARDHPIPPRRRRKLQFFWENPPKGAPRWFNGYAGQPVSHPGNKPMPFFFPTLAGFGGLSTVFRTEATKTISMIDMIAADLVGHWNAGA
jgi:hypothetical protein